MDAAVKSLPGYKRLIDLLVYQFILQSWFTDIYHIYKQSVTTLSDLNNYLLFGYKLWSKVILHTCLTHWSEGVIKN